MAESTAHEPTMEEILASIRRIISEDDAPQEEAVAAPEPEPAVSFEPDPVEDAFDAAPADDLMEVEDDDVLELTEVSNAGSSVSMGDLDIYEPEPEPVPVAAPAPKPAPVAAAPAPAPKAALVSDATASTAASAFGALTSALLVPKDGRTLEDFMTDMMRPMLQQWLDAHLPAIVEEQVRLEVERISRQGRH